MPTRPLRHLTVFLLAAAAAWCSAAQDGERTWRLPNLHEQIAAAFDDRNYQRAAELCARALEIWPSHPTVLYNAACAHARLGDREKAVDHLFNAVRAGFTEFDHLEGDPDLDSIRDHPVYAQILEARTETYRRVAEKQLNAARKEFGDEGYRYESDHEHRINYATALDDVSHREMRQMVERQIDLMSNMLFESPPNYFVLIAVPEASAASRFIRDPQIGGVYDHATRRLVARDIGVMLRHELVHVAHFGHMERINQSHRLWVQEGLATLFETYEANPDGAVRFLPNSRHNVIRNLVRNELHLPWQKLLTMPAEEFMNDAERTYPHVRSIFRFLAERDRLGEWYRTYVDTFEEDRSGIRAFERLFDEPLEKVERRWRNWVKGQAALDEFVTPGDAALGVIAFESAVNDGVLVESVLPHSAAWKAAIQPGDIIVSINGEPTRSFRELVAIIAARNVGDAVTVRFRRGAEYQTVHVILEPHN